MLECNWFSQSQAYPLFTIRIDDIHDIFKWQSVSLTDHNVFEWIIRRALYIGSIDYRVHSGINLKHFNMSFSISEHQISREVHRPEYLVLNKRKTECRVDISTLSPRASDLMVSCPAMPYKVLHRSWLCTIFSYFKMLPHQQSEWQYCIHNLKQIFLDTGMQRMETNF